MKVKINFTVDIDKEAWIIEYGTEPSKVREDVKAFAEYSIHQHLDEIGMSAPSMIWDF